MSWNRPLSGVCLVSAGHAGLAEFTPSSQIQLAAGREVRQYPTITFSQETPSFSWLNTPKTLHDYLCTQSLVNQAQTSALQLETRRCTFSFDSGYESTLTHTHSDECLASCITGRWAHQNQSPACGDSLLSLGDSSLLPNDSISSINSN